MVNIKTNNWNDVKKLDDLPLNKPGQKFLLTSYLDNCGYCVKTIEESVNPVCNAMEKRGNKCYGINGGTANGQSIMKQLGIRPAFPQDYMCETLESKNGKPKLNCAVGEGWIPKADFVKAAEKKGLIKEKDVKY